MKIVKAYPFIDAFGGVVIKAITDEGFPAFIPNAESDIGIWKEFLADGGVIDHDYVEPVEVGPVPATISDRQFAQQLAKLGLITNEEALAWVKAGVVPAAFDAFVQSLPEAQQFDAEMLLSGATQFDRYHQLTETFGAARGMTPEQIDDVWRAAAAL